MGLSGESLRQLVETEGKRVVQAQKAGQLPIDWSVADCQLETGTTRIYFGPYARRANVVGAGRVAAARRGEILRHEVNNPLTGILGNTELLLARRDGLPPGAIERLETIAELAVRLRETVRRLSNAWEEHYEAARPA